MNQAKQPAQIIGTLVVSCPDQKGLIATLAQVLADHGINIIDTQQHTDLDERMFFQRLRFDATELDLSRSQFKELLGEQLLPLEMKWRISFADEKKRVAIFTSKFEHCVYDLLIRHRLGELDCEIPLILSNHSDLEPVAKSFNIPYKVFAITKENKDEQERAEIDFLKENKIDLVILARYMQILSPAFIEEFPNQIINIHHGTLPAFMGAKPYHQAHARGVKLIGATAHYATSDLDQGPIIAQEVISCSHNDNVDDLIRKGRDMERITLGRAVRAHLEERIIVHAGKTVVF